MMESTRLQLRDKLRLFDMTRRKSCQLQNMAEERVGLINYRKCLTFSNKLRYQSGLVEKSGNNCTNDWAKEREKVGTLGAKHVAVDGNSCPNPRSIHPPQSRPRPNYTP